MKITKSGVQSLEIFGKLFDFRFEYLNPNSIKSDEPLCEHCPLLDVCDKVPDPRHFINSKKYDEMCSFNDFCLSPATALYGESVRTILANLSGKIMSEDQILEYLMKKDNIDKCLDLGFLKKGNKIEVIDYTKTDLIKKEESLSTTDRDFLSKLIGRWEVQELDNEAADLIPVKEDIIKYIKEVVINFIKFKPFTPVIDKNTSKTGLVKEVTSNGILVLFDSINEQLCKVEGLELLEKQEDSEYKPFDLVLCKSTGQWGVVKKSTKDEVVVNGFDLENYISEEEYFYKPEDLELL